MSSLGMRSGTVLQIFEHPRDMVDLNSGYELEIDSNNSMYDCKSESDDESDTTNTIDFMRNFWALTGGINVNNDENYGREYYNRI
jgi:hypothetical protein